MKRLTGIDSEESCRQKHILLPSARRGMTTECNRRVSRSGQMAAMTGGKSDIKTVISILALCALVTLLPGCVSQSQLYKPGQARGQVVSSEWTGYEFPPLAGIRVYLVRVDYDASHFSVRDVLTTQTDAQGRWSLAGLAPGSSYVVCLTAPYELSLLSKERIKTVWMSSDPDYEPILDFGILPAPAGCYEQVPPK